MAKSSRGGKGKSVLQPKVKYPEANYWKGAGKGAVPFIPGTKKEPAGNTNDKRPKGEV